MKLRARASSLAGAFALTCLAFACADPTELVVHVTTDVPCSDAVKVELRVAKSVAELDGPNAQVTETAACKAGDLGSLIVIPSGDDDALVYLRVSLGKTAADCSPAGASCIVATKVAKFVSHTAVDVPIALNASCRGVACTAGNTCASGACVSAGP
ncbi:hypothetical protein BH09MYX1_BH09MYX1_23200 [soil metagenome]